MSSLMAESADILAAFMDADSWMISEALRADGAWALGLVAMLLGGGIILAIYRLVPLIDRHLERTVMVGTYLVIAAVICVEVFRRFVLNQQAPWSTTLPPYLFLIMTWVGCAYNVRLKTHLSFIEFRMNMPRWAQMGCLFMDAVLWLGMAWVVIVTTARTTANSAANFQILLGTDNIQQWWFMIAVPISFTMLAARVMENLLDDLSNFRNGRKLIAPAVIGGD